MFSHKHISKITVFIALFIIVSAYFTRQLARFAKANLGETGFLIIVIFCFAILGLISVVLIILRNPTFLTAFIFIGTLLIGTALSLQLRPSEVKIHAIEYAVLGWFAAKDFLRANRKIKGAVLALFFCFIVGVLDEVFQLFLPWRVYDTMDILLNSGGALWGIILCLIYQNKNEKK